jgi:hypothetical protein
LYTRNGTGPNDCCAPAGLRLTLGFFTGLFITLFNVQGILFGLWHLVFMALLQSVFGTLPDTKPPPIKVWARDCGIIKKVNYPANN